ncbi:FHA domain-containing protein [Mycolicibacterium sp. HK-90]|uniref:FHA domain-containing protein n=1 Tax=Mycolicibacterium sp. HK-90 TaxID=3056937 RepID=UPI00265A01E2|nr:FHA domain-containing protein [Mycolicibacterium sp. HK-90]WKG03619.1 FHA domain-containing protein [Mycolicibacterium sp. HK-90]
MEAAVSSNPDTPDLVLAVGGRLTLARAADGDLVIGREIRLADVRLDHPAVSRIHARLDPGPRWQIIDFESRNGIYIDGHRVYKATITDGMTVAFGAAEGPTVTFRYGTDVFDKLRRLGRAVSGRIEDLGLSRRDLRLQADVDSSILDDLLGGRYWPSKATRRAIDSALCWPPGSLAAICDGTAPEEITDVITPAIRQSLLLDSAALRLDSIAADLLSLPTSSDPGYRAQSALLQRQIEEFDSSLSAQAPNARSEFAQLLQSIAQIYRRRLSLANAATVGPRLVDTPPSFPRTPLRSHQHDA